MRAAPRRRRFTRSTNRRSTTASWHRSAEPGHRRLLDCLGKEPLFDLGMRLGEASGATLAIAIVKGALACHSGMATFAEAGVSGKDETPR